MAAKVIAVAQAKGGVGKSTLSANLAATFCDSRSTLVIDCDPPQNSILAWHKVREEYYEETGMRVDSVARPSDLLSLLEKYSDEFEVIILDGPPHISPMTRAMVAIASMVIVPLAPSPVEIWSFQEMDKLMSEAKKLNPGCLARICWTRVRKRVRSSEDLIQDVKKASHIKPLATQLTQRVAYVDSFAQGQTVYEWPDTIARAEIWSLYSGVQRLLKRCPDPNYSKRPDILSFSKQ